MNKKTLDEFTAEYPFLMDAVKLSPNEALWMAYNLGVMDGGLKILERQAIARDIAEMGDPWGRA